MPPSGGVSSRLTREGVGGGEPLRTWNARNMKYHIFRTATGVRKIQNASTQPSNSRNGRTASPFGSAFLPWFPRFGDGRGLDFGRKGTSKFLPNTCGGDANHCFAETE